MKARDIMEIDFDAITFADDADAYADLNTQEDTLHHMSNPGWQPEMTAVCERFRSNGPDDWILRDASTFH